MKSETSSTIKICIVLLATVNPRSQAAETPPGTAAIRGGVPVGPRFLAHRSSEVGSEPVSRARPDTPLRRMSSRISQTQLTLRLAGIRARATVVAKTDGTLTVETAAHFLAATDVGSAIVIESREGRLGGRVVEVTRNPKFPTALSKAPGESAVAGAVGVDSEIVAIEVDLDDAVAHRVFEAIRAVEMTRDLRPSGTFRILSVHIVDQYGGVHVVRAGNHLNPKSLVWGRER